MSSDANRANGGKKKPPKADGRNARERARVAAQQEAMRKKRRNLGLLILAIVVVVAAVGIGIGYATNFGKPSASSYTGKGWGPVTITNGKPIVLGDKNAPVTIKLYEDFRCPHCAEFEQKLGDTITSLQKDGKVKVELYVLTVIDDEDHQQGSLRSGNAMAAAAAAGFGEAYYNGLWANYGKNWTNDQLIDLGKQVGGDQADATFSSAVNDMKYQAWMSSAAQAATTDQVQGTPTVFINNEMKKDAAAWSPQQLRDAVNKAS
jgi:protein-disulfide isomerase